MVFDAYLEARAYFADPRLEALPHARLLVWWDGNSPFSSSSMACWAASPSTPA
jgi:hypothetical protein